MEDVNRQRVCLTNIELMTFKDSVITCLSKKYAAFAGRACRSEYWWFILFTFIVNIVLSLVSDLVSMIAGLVMFLPALSVTVRRIHDVNKSAWFVFLPTIALILSVIICAVGLAADSKMIVLLGASIAGLGGVLYIAVFVMSVLKGTAGPNRFGEDPLASSEVL